MTPTELLKIIAQSGRLKTTPRHCFTEEDRYESVAEHSWRAALIALLLEGTEETQNIDINKVIKMLLIHDLGESFTGDIPTFNKTENDTRTEDTELNNWIAQFPEPQKTQWLALIEEMNSQKTDEAKLYKSIDKIEAVISHDESDIKTWLPLEYDLQLTYGRREAACNPLMEKLHDEVDKWTLEKINENKTESGTP